MRKIKNKLFYLNSSLFYILLLFTGLIFSAVFIEPYANDFLISKFASNGTISQDIIEVIVDDASNQKYTLPKDKAKFADLLHYFSKYTQAKIIGFDFMPQTFSQNPDDSEKKLINQIGKMRNMVSAFLPEINNSDEDKHLLNDFKLKYSLNVKLNRELYKSPYNGVVITSKQLKDNTSYYGSVIADGDVQRSNKVRDFANIINIKDGFYPSLALKMYLLANNTNDIEIDYDYITIPKTGLKIKYNYYEGTFSNWIRFYKLYGGVSDYTYPMISAYRILDTYYEMAKGITPDSHPERFNMNDNHGLVNPEIFKDKVIFIGGNISGPSDDVLSTPIQSRHPGVDLHATIYNNLLSNHFLNCIDFVYSTLIFIVLCILAFVIILRAKFLKGLTLLILSDILFLVIVFVSASNGLLISYATPIFCQFVTAVFAYSFKFLAENRNKEQIKNAMGKYLSQDVMKKVVKNIDDLKLGGKRSVVTVLFSDIRGFTSLSEKMSAEEVSSILNEYFSHMEPIISKYNGVINKFIGDAIMAIFGEPIADVNHPKNAVKCAYEMLKEVEYLREKWLYEGKPKFDIGIGINTGEVFIGNIGTETRMEYTVIGDTVNLASRIESFNKVYKTNLLVSESTYSYISDCADVIKIKEVQIRGKSKKMNIYEILRIET